MRGSVLNLAAVLVSSSALLRAVLGELEPPPVLHVGEDCFTACGGVSGYCEFCGAGNACCREGWESDPEECRRAMGFQTHMHECVGLSVDHPGEDCWGRCSEGTSGHCDWCGKGNACCKAGFADDPPECKRAVGFNVAHHQCVKLGVESAPVAEPVQPTQSEAETTAPAQANQAPPDVPAAEATDAATTAAPPAEAADAATTAAPKQHQKQMPQKIPQPVGHPRMVPISIPHAAVDPLQLVMGGLRDMAAKDLAHGGGVSAPFKLSNPGRREEDLFPGTMIISRNTPPGQDNPFAMMLKALADGSGQLGESSHFQVEDTEAGVRIVADLPGHKLGEDGPHPLQVRVIGAAVVVKGAHVNPPMVTEFQRTFHMPQRVSLSKIRVDYSQSTGKLLITVPSRLLTEGEEDEEEETARSKTDNKAGGAFAEIEGKLPQFFKDKEKVLQDNKGFMPAKKDKHKEMADLLSNFEKQFARHDVKEDNTTYLGCFAESDLPADKVKVPEIGAYSEMKARAEGGPPVQEPVEVLTFNLATVEMEIWMELAGGARKLITELPAFPGPPAPQANVERYARPMRLDVMGGNTLLWVEKHSKDVKQRAYVFSGRHLLVYNGTAQASSRWRDEPLAEKREEFFAIARSMGEHVVQRAEWTLSGYGQGYVFSAVPSMPPSFGVSECGMRCIDGQHWCGCDPAADKEIFNCPGKERRYAVYALPYANGTRAVPPRSRAVWHLHEDEEGSPIVEVHAPPGRTLKNENGKVVVVGQSSIEDPAASGLAKAMQEADRQQTEVEVPVSLQEEHCEFTKDKSSVRCHVPKQHVKEVPVRYTYDEL